MKVSSPFTTEGKQEWLSHHEALWHWELNIWRDGSGEGGTESQV